MRLYTREQERADPVSGTGQAATSAQQDTRYADKVSLFKWINSSLRAVYRLELTEKYEPYAPTAPATRRERAESTWSRGTLSNAIHIDRHSETLCTRNIFIVSAGAACYDKYGIKQIWHQHRYSGRTNSNPTLLPDTDCDAGCDDSWSGFFKDWKFSSTNANIGLILRCIDARSRGATH